jgi:hypothetical protein
VVKRSTAWMLKRTPGAQLLSEEGDETLVFSFPGTNLVVRERGMHVDQIRTCSTECGKTAACGSTVDNLGIESRLHDEDGHMIGAMAEMLM